MSSQAKSMSEPIMANTPARAQSSMSHRILAVVGLAVGAVLGFGGNFLTIIGWIVTVLQAGSSLKRKPS